MSESLSSSRSSTSSPVIVSANSLSSNPALVSSVTLMTTIYSSPPPSSTANEPPINGPSSSAYLYTVLVAVSLILIVTSVVIVRSLLHLNGTRVPPTLSKSRTKLARKPDMFEVWLPKGGISGRGRGHLFVLSKTYQQWDDIMPFSVSFIYNNTKPNSSLFLWTLRTLRRAHTVIFNSISYLWRWFAGILPLPISTPLPSPLTSSYLNSINPDLTQPGTVRATFLIAMPSQIPSLAYSSMNEQGWDEQGLHIEFGVAEVEMVSTSHEQDGKASMGEGEG